MHLECYEFRVATSTRADCRFMLSHASCRAKSTKLGASIGEAPEPQKKVPMCLCAYFLCSWHPPPHWIKCHASSVHHRRDASSQATHSYAGQCHTYATNSAMEWVSPLDLHAATDSCPCPRRPTWRGCRRSSVSSLFRSPFTLTRSSKWRSGPSAQRQRCMLCPASLRTMHCVELVDRVHACVHDGRVGVADGGTTRCACLVAGCSARGSCSTLRGLAGGSMHHGHGDVCQHACVCVHLCAVCE